MSTAKAPEWHDPTAPRCRRPDCRHVLDAHGAGRCVLIYCECTGWVAPIEAAV